jgi:hypothetical protein
LISSVISPYSFGLTFPAECVASTVKVGSAARQENEMIAQFRNVQQQVFMGN